MRLYEISTNQNSIDPYIIQESDSNSFRFDGFDFEPSHSLGSQCTVNDSKNLYHSHHEVPESIEYRNGCRWE